MPRFSDTEKEMLAEKLRSEGERLFIAYGVKKVSVDELVQATGMAKGSFYTFYAGKEHLYMDIVGRSQQRMWEELDNFLKQNKSLPPRELTKQAFLWMMDSISRYPLLIQMDTMTLDYLYRKIPKEAIEAHTREDGESLKKLQEYGVCFTCELPVAAKALQALYSAFVNLQQEDDLTRKEIENLILDGIVGQIVRE